MFSSEDNFNAEKTLFECFDFKLLFDSFPYAFVITNNEGKIKYINKKFESLIGYTLNEISEKEINQTLLKKGQNELRLNEILIHNNEFESKTELLHKDGSAISVLMRGNKIDLNLQTLFIFSFIEIASTIHSFKDDSLNLEIFKLLFDNSPFTIIHFDLNGVIRLCNKQNLNILGIESENIYGLNLFQLNENEIIKKQVKETLNGQKSHYEGSIKLKHRTTEHYIKIDTSPIYDKYGVMLGGIMMVEDINERKHAEIKLQKAKEKAEEADTLKTAFLANMSHEIRTPMNAIIGFSDLLLDPEISQDEKVEYVNIIKNNGNTLLNIIDDIIDIAKIEAGQIKIYKTQCNVNEILYEMFTYFNKQKKLLKKDTIDIILNPNNVQNLIVLSDPYRLRQIISNLLNNALKFTDKGFITFGCNVEQNYVKFYVTDTGIGIPEDKLEEIFKPFRQADFSPTRRYGGTGLGLTISKNLVEILGGSMWVISTPGKGSTFYFTLPYQKIGATMFSDDEKTVSISNYNWENKVILIVEDDVTNYKFLERTLRKSKAEIIWAKDGKPAVDLCQTDQKIDLILMDIQMPRMDGLEATKLIRKIRKDIPIIAQTAYVMTSDKDKSLKAGCNDYIAKPIKIPLLLEKINKYLMT
jgi:PAS domain S-box-containing protein